MAEYYQGNDQAWADLQRRYEAKLLAYVSLRRSGIHEPAKRENDREIVNRTLIKAVLTRQRESGRFDPEKGNFRGWIFGICAREITNLGRERRPQADEPDSIGPESGPAGEAPLPYEILQECVDGLDTELHELANLKFFAGVNQKEIANRLAMSEPTVSRRLNAAMEKLRVCMQNKGIDYWPTKA